MDIDVDELLQLEAAQTAGGPEGPEDEIIPTVNVRKNNHLENESRKQLLIDMFALANNELILRRGMSKAMQVKYNISRWTVDRMWKKAVQQKLNGEVVHLTSNKANCGRRHKFSSSLDLIHVPLRKRTTMRSFAAALNCSPSTVDRLVSRGIIRSHSNSIKPRLTEKHRVEMIKFVKSFVIPPTVLCKPKFDKLYNMVHVDEKWFFVTKAVQMFYLLDGEEDPYRSCQSKGFITKVMFLGALARPRFDEGEDVLWDGKISIFPFTEEVATLRGSINRPKGTVETKPIQHITKDTIRNMFLDTLLPKIREKWPTGGLKQIWIQQDNVKPHIQPDDPAFLETSKVDGFDIRIIQQPAQSPDQNILDLGFFRAIQSIQHQSFPDYVLKLIESVLDAYNVYDPKNINYTWLSLMNVMVEVLKQKGENAYRLPHIGKRTMKSGIGLTSTVEVDVDLLTYIEVHLNSNVVFI